MKNKTDHNVALSHNAHGTMHPRRNRFFLAAIAIALSGTAHASKLAAVHRFTNTGAGTPSNYAQGAQPYAELLQASDGNFYGTTVYGGAGLCPNNSNGGVLGCGTIFRMTPAGAVTTLYSFPYDTTSKTAPNGAFPTAGLIQAADGNLYGVAQDGGPDGFGCNGVLGCGTLFRISLAGAFKLLHQFCAGDGCANANEGGRPMAHLVQTANKLLCGTTSQGGIENEGTVFCASTAGHVLTIHRFHYEDGTDGYDPMGALLVGPDGSTLYGLTTLGGKNGGSAGGGIVFSIKSNRLVILHAFDNYHSSDAGTFYQPMGALIFGADGKLYGVTSTGGDGGAIFSLNPDGTGFAAGHVFTISSNAPGDPAAGLLLASNGLMYGTTLFGSIEMGFNQDCGVLYSYNPATGAFKAVADFTGAVGAASRAAPVEGTNKFLYTTASLYGGSNANGTDAGSVVRLVPALAK